MFRHTLSAIILAAVSSATALSASSGPVVTQKPADVQKPTDATLQDRIAYRLDVSPLVKKFDVKVKVELGIAVLSGTVATVAEKTEVARLAKIDGINRVENNVVVDPNVTKTLADHIKAGLSKTGDAISDTWITGKIKWFFLGDDLLKGSDINVDTAANVVTLKGTVRSTAGRDRAVFLARDTSAVHKVVDELKIVPIRK